MIPVVVSAEAEADIEEIGEFIAQDNPDRAVTFVTELRAKALAVRHYPNAYPSRDDLRPGMRVAIYGRYNIYFEIFPTEVVIARVVHSARDQRGIFGIE